MGEAQEAALRSGGKRRYRSTEEKRLIVEETLTSTVSVATVARQHGVNANQLFTWRKLYQRGLLEPSVREKKSDELRLLPVAVLDVAEKVEEETAPAVVPSVGTIHIEFHGRVLIRVESGADPVLVRAVLETVTR